MTGERVANTSQMIFRYLRAVTETGVPRQPLPAEHLFHRLSMRFAQAGYVKQMSLVEEEPLSAHGMIRNALRATRGTKQSIDIPMRHYAILLTILVDISAIASLKDRLPRKVNVVVIVSDVFDPALLHDV